MQPNTSFDVAGLNSTGVAFGFRGVVSRFIYRRKESPMPTRLGIALLGVTVGGVTFLITGFAVFLTISQMHDRTQARAPMVVASSVQVAQLPPQR
jgi:hypothetical protein